MIHLFALIESQHATGESKPAKTNDDVAGGKEPDLKSSNYRDKYESESWENIDTLSYWRNNEISWSFVTIESDPKQAESAEASGNAIASEFHQDDVFEVQPINTKSPQITYRGKRKSVREGMNSKRFDVVYKTLIRSLRRYLWSRFLEFSATHQNLGILADRNYSDIFDSFYNSEFKIKVDWLRSLDYEQEHQTKYALSLFMTTEFHIKRDKWIQRNLSNLLGWWMKGFVNNKYKALFKNEGVSLLFRVLVAQNIISEMAPNFEPIKSNQKVYTEALQKISEFHITKDLVFKPEI